MSITQDSYACNGCHFLMLFWFGVSAPKKRDQPNTYVLKLEKFGNQGIKE
jgi:hypothetical protein